MLDHNTAHKFLLDTLIFAFFEFSLSVRADASFPPLLHCRERFPWRDKMLNTSLLQHRTLGVRAQFDIVVCIAEIEKAKSVDIVLVLGWLNDAMTSRRVISSTQEVNAVSCIDNLQNVSFE